MIRASRNMVVLSGLTALALHGVGAWFAEPQARIETEGGAGATETMLGSSFADMVAGAARPVTNSTVTPDHQAENAVSPAEPVATPLVKPQDSPPPPVTSPAESAQATVAVVPEMAPRPEMAESVPSAPPVAPVDPAYVAEPSAPQAVVEADPEPETGLQVSRRPEARPREVEESAARRAPEPEPDRKAEVREPTGNTVTQNATQGSTSGRETATAARAGRDTSSQSSEQGNAAASNYPGQVMRHLARVPRPRADTRGAALVQFSIADGGRLASVSLAQSSGSTRLDRAALTVVQRAAPFPSPPQGAQRSFSIQIKGR